MTTVYDNFNRGDEQLNATATWIGRYDGASNVPPFAIYSEEVGRSAASTMRVAYYNQVFGGNQRAKVKLSVLPANTSGNYSIGPMIRMGEGTTWYFASYGLSAGAIVVGTASVSELFSIPATVQAGDTLELRGVENGSAFDLEVLHNGVVVGSYSHATPWAGPYKTGIAQRSSDGYNRIDDWEGGDYVPSASDTITLTPDPASVVVGSTRQVTISRSSPAPAGAGVTYNLTSSNTVVATVPATVSMAAGATTTAFDITGVSVGTGTTITATNAADSSETKTLTASVVGQIKLKLLAHIDALGATNVKGAVFEAPTGGALLGAPIGEFTGAAFGSTAESGQAPLTVNVNDFGGSHLTITNTPVCVWEGTSAAGSAILGSPTAIGSVGPHECTVIEE